MKTKIIFLITFCFVLILGACKKKEVSFAVQGPIVKETVKITQEQFILNLGEHSEVWNLKIGESINVPINPSEVLSPTSEVAVVEKFKSAWTYDELMLLLKKVPLTVVWVGDENSHLLVMNYFDLRDKYNSEEDFLVLYPKPMYHVIAGSKEYWITPGNKFWKTL